LTLTPRALSTLSADDWTRMRWVDVTKHGDSERMFLDSGLRTPGESAREQANVEAIGWEVYRGRKALVRSK
jgi:hypothetical protein